MRFTVLQLKEMMDTSSRTEEADRRRFVNASRKSSGR
jgi:hypothetical protein